MEQPPDGEHELSPEEQAREARIKRLILAAIPRCTTCQHDYQVDDFAVIGHREHLWMVTAICEHCHRQGFITAAIYGRGTEHRPNPAPTHELTPAEQRQFADTPPIDTDDLLDLHDFLDDFDGDFAALFDENKHR